MSNVNHPKHYTSHPSGIECIEITRHYCFSIGNAIKYLWRAIVYVLGGEREAFTHNEKLKADIEYIQEVYGFKGGEIPDEEVVKNVRGYVLSLELEKDYPQWATKLMNENYNINL